MYTPTVLTFPFRAVPRERADKNRSALVSLHSRQNQNQASIFTTFKFSAKKRKEKKINKMMMMMMEEIAAPTGEKLSLYRIRNHTFIHATQWPSWAKTTQVSNPVGVCTIWYYYCIYLAVVRLELVRHLLDGKAGEPGVPLVGLHVLGHVLHDVVHRVKGVHLPAEKKRGTTVLGDGFLPPPTPPLQKFRVLQLRNPPKAKKKKKTLHRKNTIIAVFFSFIRLGPGFEKNGWTMVYRQQRLTHCLQCGG